MNADTRRHIDAARDVLVGVVPNPTSQIDQITNALVYKFMDDMDQNAIKAGGEPSFFVGELEKYAWSRLIDTRMGNQEKMNLFAEALVKFSESDKLPELFRSIFKSAYLPYRSPEVLGMFIKEINYFDYTHPEDLGDAYEYLLSVMSSQGDAGQFRTPRHIIDFIVEVVNPTKDDKVLDPACGTAGFLISAYKHILKQHDGKDDPGNKEKPLTPGDRKNLMANFEGYDIDPGMVRIAQVNMYLHQFRNPKISQYDSLSMEERWNDKFDVILANPPFMSPKGGIKPHSKFSVKSSRSEVLFVDYIMNHLRPRGRAGVIVPEGIIFQQGIAYKQLRKNLVNDGLYAVVSLPNGVFSPYSGVKTSILLFENEFAKTVDEILFVKVENDGFDLGAQRKPNGKSDLQEAIDVIRKWKSGTKVETKLINFVGKERLAETGEYNLSGERYKIKVENDNKWPLLKLSDIAIVKKGSPITKNEAVEGQIPVIAGGQQPAYYHNMPNREGATITISASGAYAGFVNFFNTPIFASDCTTIQSNEKQNVNIKFIYFLLKGIQKDIYKMQTGGGQPHVYPKDIASINIPLPPLEVQERIVAELDGYQKIIDGAKMVVENWKPSLEINENWNKVKLGEIFKLSSGKGLTKNNMVAGPYPVYGGNGINGHHNEFLVDKPTIVIGRVGEYCGAVHLTSPKSWVTDNGLYVVQYLKEINQQYLALALEALNINQYAKRGGQPSISQSNVYELDIYLPNLSEQEIIVQNIQKEKELVGSNTELINIFSLKVLNKIKEVWGE